MKILFSFGTEFYNHIDLQSQIEWEKECFQLFENKLDSELLECYNSALGKSAWGISRLIYIKAMKAEMIKRGWDISSIMSINVDIHLSEHYRCIFVNKKLTLVNQI